MGNPAVAYRPWVIILASPGLVTLEPHRILEAKHPFTRGEIGDVRQIRTQKGDEPMGEKVIFGSPHQSPRHLCLKLVTESSFCVFLVKSAGKFERDRGKNKYCARVGVHKTGKKTKTRSWSGLMILVGHWCRKAKCCPGKGPLQLFCAELKRLIQCLIAKKT